MQRQPVKVAPFNRATIQDVQLVPLIVHVDDRGYLMEIIHVTDPFTIQAYSSY
jgi:dTDP-4-dehydrorhamnose 3,5-epimerase-like enzyme